MVDETSQRSIAPRRRRLFEHVLRYGVTTIDAAHRLFTGPEGCKHDAARTWLGRLVKRAYLTNPTDPWPHYRLTSKAIDVIEPLLPVLPGTYSKACGTIAKDTLQLRLTILAFCCLNSTQRRVLLQHEFDKHFGEYLPKDVPSWPYYIDRKPDGAVMHLLMLDTQSGVSEQVNRVNIQQQRRIKHDALRKLEICGRFRITLMTAFKSRAEELRLALDDAQMTGVDVEVVPQAESYLTERIA